MSREYSHKKFYLNFIAPLSIVFIYSYFAIEKGTVFASGYANFMIYNLLLRGFAAISIGCIDFYLVKYIRKHYIINNFFAWILTTLSFGLVIMVMGIKDYNEFYSFYCIPLLSIGVVMAWICNLNTNLFQKFLVWFEKYTFPIYLNHLFVYRVLEIYFKYSITLLICYFIIITVYSIMTYHFVKLCCKFVNRRIIPLIVQKR